MKSLVYWHNLRIKYKLILSYSLILLLAVLVGSYVIYSLVRQTLETHLEQELSHTTSNLLTMVRALAAISIKNHLRAVAEKNREVVKYYYQEYLSGRLEEEEAKKEAGKILASQTIGQTGYIFAWDITKAPEVIPLAVHPKIQGRDVAAVDFVQKAAVLKTGYLEYKWKNPGEKTAREKAMYISFFRPWNWVIAASSYRTEFNELIALDDFRATVSALRFGEEGYSFIVDGQGSLIVPPLRSGTVFEPGNARGAEIIGELTRLKTGKIFLARSEPGEGPAGRRLLIFRYSPEYDWIVASSGYPRELYAWLNRIRNIAVVVLGLVMLMLLPVTLRISSSIADPLRQLMDKFAAASRGDLSVRMKIDTENEIGLLSRYFNEFMEKLESSLRRRKLAEADLHTERERFRVLAEQSPLGISLVHQDGNYEYINPAYVKMFGYNLGEVPNGREWFKLAFPDPESRHNTIRDWFDIIAELKAGLTLVRSHAVTCKNGEKKIVRFRVVKLPDDNYLVIHEDVTDHVRMEEELRHTRNYLQNVIDSMPSFLIGVDSLCRVAWWNSEAEKIIGQTRGQARGQDLSLVFPLLTGQISLVKESIVLNEPRRINKFRTLAGGRTVYLDIMIYPLASSQVEGAVIRLDDVTIRVRMEEVMVQTEKMLSMGELAAGLAHEINNPLEGMIHGALNIGRRLSTDVNANHRAAEECGIQLEKIRSFLETRQIFKLLDGIIASGVKAARIVTNMLDFSRKSEAEIEPANLNELLTKAAELVLGQYALKRQYDFSRIDIVTELAPGLPPVWCEPVKIEQVILNLLRNAAQALAEYHDHDPGWSPRIVLRTGLEGEMVFIRVEDNGPGMNENIRRRVFEPFFTTKPAGLGTGLGLSVSYFIVTEDHRGTLSVESEPGKGAKFVIGLPLNRDNQAPLGQTGQGRVT